MESFLTTPDANRDSTSGHPFGLLDMGMPNLRSSLLSRSTLASDFERKRDDLETEARAENQKRTTLRRGVGGGLTGIEERSAERPGKLAWSGARRAYSFANDADEARENRAEVRRFNQQLEAAESEARLLNSGQDKDQRAQLTPPAPASDYAFAVVTSVINIVREPLVVLDNTLRLKGANQAFYRTFALTEAESKGTSMYDLAQGAWNIPTLNRLLDQAARDKRAYEELEAEVDFPQLGFKTLRFNVRRVSVGDMILVSIRDVTPRRRTEVELKRLQDELRQGQKMEVIGRLAGGVAHDFNNILTGISGFSEVLQGTLDPTSNSFHYASEIHKASERAAALTHQLLAFSRRQVLSPQVVNPNDIIRDLRSMLDRLIGETIQLADELEEGLGCVRADAGQLSQVILNLCLNAKDAMSQGGTISIKTCNTTSTDEISIRSLAAGDYVTIAITDSGAGMDETTQEHLFEPFFTTKPEGSGTGLGLSTVIGIVKQSGGEIHFTSTVDVGTTFWIDFPRVAASQDAGATQVQVQALGGNETILLVDDDDLVRELAELLLQQMGYKVLLANRPAEALALCSSYAEPIDLILTDLVMPGGMDGIELGTRAKGIQPGLRVIVMSGYTTDTVIARGYSDSVSILQKPFTQQQLANEIRRALDSPVNGPLTGKGMN